MIRQRKNRLVLKGVDIMRRIVPVVVVLILTSSGALREMLANETNSLVHKIDLDVSKPELWDAIVTNHIESLDKLVDNLTSVIKDSDRGSKVRRKAISLLATVGTPRSIEFLVANVDLQVPLADVRGDEDMFRQRACLYVLYDMSLTKRNWSIVPAILKKAEESTKVKGVVCQYYAGLLKSICGREVAHQLIAERLTLNQDQTVQENLRVIRDAL
jgi:hypothetical protein